MGRRLAVLALLAATSGCEWLFPTSLEGVSFAGTWKEDCELESGIRIANAGLHYTVAVFGPDGEHAPGPPINFHADRRVTLHSPDRLDFGDPDYGVVEYHRCE